MTDTMQKQIKQEETVLSDLKKRRADHVSQDRVVFEAELLAR